MKNSKIRKSARGQDCQVRLPNICNFNNETTVLAHMGGGGMAAKANDIHGAYCCSSCHDEIDGRTLIMENRFECELYGWHGVRRTQEILLQDGLIRV